MTRVRIGGTAALEKPRGVIPYRYRPRCRAARIEELQQACDLSPTATPRRLALPPADGDQASHKCHPASPEPVRAADSGDQHTEADEEADIQAKHHPTLPYARRPPTPAITLRSELEAGLGGRGGKFGGLVIALTGHAINVGRLTRKLYAEEKSPPSETRGSPPISDLHLRPLRRRDRGARADICLLAL